MSEIDTAEIAEIDGSNVLKGYFDLPNSEYFKNNVIGGEKSFTIEVNVKLKNYYNVIFSMDNNKMSFNIYYNLRFYANNDRYGGWPEARIENAISGEMLEQWQHIAAVYSTENDGTMQLYLNGKILVTLPGTGVIGSPDNNFCIGYLPNSTDGNNKTAEFSSLRIYSNALTEDELNTSETEKLLRNDVQLWYDFGSEQAEEQTVIADKSGNGHECLWNGYVWPFATSQTLTALLQAIKDDSVCREEYTSMLWKLLNQYANQHYRITEDGKKIMWIDEVGTPYEHSWSSRKILEEAGWDINRGGYERGKDYNHSTFCDIVLSALTGFELKGGEAVFKPVIPDDMNYYSIDNLHIQGSEYRIVYDKTGEKYGVSAGLHIYKNGTEIQV